jgi:hypothetical protein
MRRSVAAFAAAIALSTAAPAEEPTANPEVSEGAASSGPAGPGPADGAATPAVAGSPAPAAALSPAASPSAVAAVPGAPPPRPPARAAGPSQWGVLLEAGLPEGATLSAAYRPVPSLRLFAGPAWNYVGFGVQGGIAIAPWHLAATPVVTVEAGRYFGADVSFVTKGGQGIPPEMAPLLKDMTYTYAAIHAGIELGSQNGFSFAIDVGLGYIALETKGTVTKSEASGSTVTFKDPRLSATLPSLKLGVHYWF